MSYSWQWYFRLAFRRRLTFDDLLDGHRERWRLERASGPKTLPQSVFLRQFSRRYHDEVGRYTSSISPEAKIGEGVLFRHYFNGIHIGPEAEIGDGCTIMQNVTLGVNISPDGISSGGPKIGRRVFIGPNSCLIGDCHVGDDVRIGAGVVLTNVDVPANSTIVNPSAYDVKNRRNVYAIETGAGQSLPKR